MEKNGSENDDIDDETNGKENDDNHDDIREV